MLKILEFLEGRAIDQVDFFHAVLASGYGAGMSKIDYKFHQIQKDRERNEFLTWDVREKKRKLKLFIAKMKRDGLIAEVEGRGYKLLPKGKTKMKILQNKLPGRDYKKEKQDQVIIISFDIPEKLRHKRNWLREVIKNLGFKMIHQSVWIGKTKIPKELINDLDDLKILEYIEIFEVTKGGTLRKL